jgi:hypothetical protein
LRSRASSSHPPWTGPGEPPLLLLPLLLLLLHSGGWGSAALDLPHHCVAGACNPGAPPPPTNQPTQPINPPRPPSSARSWYGYIKDYDGGTLMECTMHVHMPYTALPQTIRVQRAHLDAQLKALTSNHLTYPGLQRSGPGYPGARGAGSGAGQGQGQPCQALFHLIARLMAPLHSTPGAPAATAALQQAPPLPAPPKRPQPES